MSGLAGVPDADWGLAGRASRAFPNSASAPQGSPCEFALCCYFYFQGPRVFKQCSSHRRGSGESSRSGAIRGGGLRSEGREAWCEGGEVRARGAVLGGRARSRFGARASPRATTRPSRRLGFSPHRSRKSEQKTNARIGTRGLAARFANARGLARAGASWRVPSLSRRERMRACFGSLGVRRVSEAPRGAEGRASVEKRKNLRNRRKRAGRDSTLMWTARG